MLRLSVLEAEKEGAPLFAFCIIDGDRESALRVAYMTLKYYEIPGSKENILVSLSRNISGKYDFCLDFGNNIGKVDIYNVSKDSLGGLLDRIKEAPGFAIICGYGENPIKLVPSSTFHIIKHDIILCGEFLTLKHDDSLWQEFLTAIDQISEENNSEIS